MHLSDLITPSTFDALRNHLDQSTFYSLFELHQENQILKCRKAELHLSLAEDDEALALLDDSLLSLGLKSKIYYAQNRHEETQKLIEQAINQFDPVTYSEHDLEGMLHIWNMQAYLHYSKADYHSSLEANLNATELAITLSMKGRLHLLSADREAIRANLGISIWLPGRETGNQNLIQHDTLVKYRKFMLEGDFEAVKTLNADLYKIARATELRRSRRFYEAADLIRNLKIQGNPGYHAGLLMLELFTYTGNRLYCNPMPAFETLEGIKTETLLLPLLAEFRALYPLGLILLSVVEPIVEGDAKRIPILRHEAYRDGIYFEAERVATLPLAFRKAWFEQEIELYGIVNNFEQLYRVERHRGRQVLKDLGLKQHEIVATITIAMGFARLLKLIPDSPYAEALERLYKHSPKMKMWIRDSWGAL